MSIKHKISAFFLSFSLIFLLSCSKTRKTEKVGEKEESQEVKSEVIDGVKHIYNSSKPLKGTITLELEKIIEIDSANDSSVPATFNNFGHDHEENIYLGNRREVKIYKFSKEGKFITGFLRKGEGPGEFPRTFSRFKIIGNDIWVYGTMKIARYDRDGHYVSERKLDKTHAHINIIDEHRFVANYNEYSKDEKEYLKPHNRVCALFGKDQVIITRLLEDEKAGFTELRSKDRILRIYEGSLTKDILTAYNRGEGNLYLFITNDYKIMVKNLQGETKLIIHRDYQNKILDDSDKEDIVGMFRDWPEDRKKLLKESLPGTFCAITGIEFIPRDHFVVRRKVGFRKDEADIFDKEGRFVYALKTSKEIPNFIRLRFFRNKVMIIKKLDDRDVYVQYRVKNLPEIFGD